MIVSLVASIPSPSQNHISIGPVDLRAYGFLIALGVLAGVWLASRRVAEDGVDPEVIPNMALWALPAAIVGARAYFVLTNWGRFSDDLASTFRVWEGGLGIPGGVFVGTIVGVWWLRRNDVPLAPVFTAVALGLPLGQIIGRFGNWFNQELYGRPTTLPWGLEIDLDHRLPGYEDPALLFHPTFAYEILWNIALLGFLVWIDRKRVLRPGALFAVYLIGYGIGRILIETVRIDPVNEFLGIRLHIWAMVAFIAAAGLYLRRYGWRRTDEPGEPNDTASVSPTKPQAPFVRSRRGKGGGARGSSPRSATRRRTSPAGEESSSGGGTATKTKPPRSRPSDSEPDTDIDPDAARDTEPKTATEVLADPAAHREPDVVADTDTDSDLDPPTVSDNGADADADSLDLGVTIKSRTDDTDTQADADADADTDTEPHGGADTAADLDTEPQADAGAEADLGGEPQADPDAATDDGDDDGGSRARGRGGRRRRGRKR